MGPHLPLGARARESGSLDLSALKRLRKAVATARAVRECGHKVLGTRAAFESSMSEGRRR